VTLDQLVGRKPLILESANINKDLLVPIIPWDKAPQAKQFIIDIKETWQNWSTIAKTEQHQQWYGLKIVQRTLKGAFIEKTILIVDPDLKPIDGDYVI
ncbi:MAG: hypothetical protein ACK4PR_10020, partial [Gammaproteobacteria bacterium]